MARSIVFRCTLRRFQTAGSGLLDVSRDGRLAVDGLLQVFDVHSGLRVVSFAAHRSTSPQHTSHNDDNDEEDHCVTLARLTADAKYVAETKEPGAAFSKVPRKNLGKLLILGATDTQVATSSRGYSATLLNIDLSILFSEVIGNCEAVVVVIVVVG